MSAVLGGVVLAAVAMGVAWRVLPWLRRGGHRYADEAALPQRTFTWVLPGAGLVGLLVGAAWADRPAHLVVFGAFAVFLVLISAIDVDVQRLPDRWTYPAMLLAPAATGLLAVVDRDLSGWLRSVLAGLVLGGGYFLLFVIGAVVGGGGLGLGDVKLAPSIGAVLGYLSWGHVVLATFAAILLGGVFAAFLLITRRGGRHSHFAFGPAMAAGAILVLAAPAVGAL
ncbi:MAG TPA: prepilin peptidase [Intrasporangiaceae bacterium]|nr:prepilin peptidase [Intrasporangiaceae bacterium]